jgi:hypothetical protein
LSATYINFAASQTFRTGERKRKPPVRGSDTGGEENRINPAEGGKWGTAGAGSGRRSGEDYQEEMLKKQVVKRNENLRLSATYPNGGASQLSEKTKFCDRDLTTCRVRRRIAAGRFLKGRLQVILKILLFFKDALIVLAVLGAGLLIVQFVEILVVP